VLKISDKVPLGKIAAGGQDGRETTQRTKGIIEGKTDGNGEGLHENGIRDALEKYGVRILSVN
jgi:hypothetical protein